MNLQMNLDSKNSVKYLDQTNQLYDNKRFLGGVLKEKICKFPKNLNAFNKSICSCQNCPLGNTRKKFVFGIGNPNADIVFVGEAPGKNEDIAGKPFVGRGGKLLDKILLDIDLEREDVYICNVLKCRPPNNRDPLPYEVHECEPYLIHQLKIIKPRLIVALGRISACTILNTKESLKNLRNRIFNYAGIDLLVTYHPAALLRNPNFKKPVQEDFQFIRDSYIMK